MSDFAVADFADVTERGAALTDAAHEHPLLPGLFFLSAPGFRSPEDIDASLMETLLTQAREGYDYCLLDSPAGLSAGFNLATHGADMAIVVATGDLSSIRDAQRTTERLYDFGIPDVRLLVNRLSKRNQKYLRGTIDDMIDDVGARLIGIVREDNNVFLAANTDTPLVLYTDGAAARDFLDVARRIRGENLPIH
jgi:septum site-determining protein MinD